MIIGMIILFVIIVNFQDCKRDRELQEQSKNTELQNKQKSESAGKNINDSSEQLNKVPKHKIDHSFVVKARIYHFIVGTGDGAGIEKPTDKYIDIKIDVWRTEVLTLKLSLLDFLRRMEMIMNAMMAILFLNLILMNCFNRIFNIFYI